MKKIVLSVMLCLCFAMGVNVFADEPAENTEPPAMTENAGGERDRMPPDGKMPNGEAPPELGKPDGKRDMKPDEFKNDAGAENNNMQKDDEVSASDKGDVNTQTPEKKEMNIQTDEKGEAQNSDDGEKANSAGDGEMHRMPDNGRNIMPEENVSKQSENENGILNFIKTYSTPLISLVLLALAYVFVIFYKRNIY